MAWFGPTTAAYMAPETIAELAAELGDDFPTDATPEQLEAAADVILQAAAEEEKDEKK